MTATAAPTPSTSRPTAPLQTPPPDRPAAHPDRPTWSLPVAFGLVIATQVLLFTGSNLPTPLFPVYEDRFGFGSGTVTLLFGAYVAVLVPTMLVFGRLGDRVGRRPLLAAGVAVTVVSCAAFAVAGSATWLYVGEIVYGVGAGMVMSCVSVAIRELHPATHVGGGALAASVAAAAGLTAGPLVGGLLASATPWPTVVPYVVVLVLATALAAALLRIPETRPVAPEAATRRPPLVHVPADIRRPFAAAAAVGAASFMVVGWVFGLAPSFLHEQLGVPISQPFVAGLFAALVVATNGAAQLLLRRHHTSSARHAALAAVVIGTAIMAVSALVPSLAMVVLGGLVAGVGTGVAQMHAMATVQHLAPAHARGSVVAAYLTACYLGLSVPVLLAGLVAAPFGLGVVTAWYAVGVGLLTGVAVVLGRARTGSAPAQPSRAAASSR